MVSTKLSAPPTSTLLTETKNELRKWGSSIILRYDSTLKPTGQNLTKPPAAAALSLNETEKVCHTGASKTIEMKSITKIRTVSANRAEIVLLRTIQIHL